MFSKCIRCDGTHQLSNRYAAPIKCAAFAGVLIASSVLQTSPAHAAQIELAEAEFSGLPVTPLIISSSHPSARFTDIKIKGAPDDPLLRVKFAVNQLDGGLQAVLRMDNLQIRGTDLAAADEIDFSFFAANRGGFFPDGTVAPVHQQNFGSAIVSSDGRAFVASEHVLSTDSSPRLPSKVSPELISLTLADFRERSASQGSLEDAIGPMLATDPMALFYFGIYAAVGGIGTFDINDIAVSLFNAAPDPVPIPPAVVLLLTPIAILIAQRRAH